MAILDHLAQAAAVLLLIELLVVLLLFLAVTGGLAFGVHWIRGKTDWAFGKVNAQLPMVNKYVRIGTDYLALPIVKGNGFADTARVTILALERQVRDRREATTVVAARSVPPPPATGPASELTMVEPLPPVQP